ncbi:hypothetical protein B566_EDAN007739 [Ephemera danica]|nr:hypothetical protein B566_EDAN007739 [Ephemera danica]
MSAATTQLHKPFKMKPTVKAAAGFDAKKDADALYKAFKGMGADEESVIAILGRRSNEQRVEIAKKYKEAHGKDLDDVMKSELKGDFEALAVASIRPHHEFLARELHDAISGLGTKEEVIAEILGVSDNKTIHKINESYQKLYDTTLEKALKKDTSGCLERLFVLLSLGNRNESDSYDASAAHNDAINLWNSEEMKPTVRDADNFDAKADATALYDAFRGSGTNESAVIGILGHRSRAQRLEIASEYKQTYGQDLEDKLKAELRGNFEKLCVALVTPFHEFLARELHAAMHGLTTNTETIAEILGVSDNKTIHKINEAYKKLFDKTLEHDLKKDTSGCLERLFVLLNLGQRDENEEVDSFKTRDDAIKLFNAGEGRAGTDEDKFIEVLAHRSRPHLRQVFVEYNHVAKNSLVETVEKEFRGKKEKTLVALVYALEDPVKFLAHRLHDSMSKLGTKEHHLTRIVLWRSELDLGDVKERFVFHFGKPLSEYITKETSGPYRALLQTLID